MAGIAGDLFLKLYLVMPCDFTVWMPSWTGLAHFASISCVQFFSPGSWYLFSDPRSQMKRWRFFYIGNFPFYDNRICRCYVNSVF